MGYQIDALAEAIANYWGASEQVTSLDIVEAKGLVEYLNTHGFRIERDNGVDVPPSAGPLQRALGMEQE